jgi:hypothetical protein
MVYIPADAPDNFIDILLLPLNFPVATAILNRDYATVKAYVISNPQIMKQLAFVNRAFHSANNYSAKGGCGNSYNMPYQCLGNLFSGQPIITLSPKQCVAMYRYTANARMTNSNLAYFMKVAFGVDNQMQSAKRTILRNGEVCVNCDLLPIIQSPTQLATNDNARVLNFMLEGKGTRCVSGDFYNLSCGGTSSNSVI